jgi:DnaJ-class molecular chaperone
MLTSGKNSFYSVLNLPDYSSLEDIKKAFKKLALTTHPDKKGNAKEFLPIQ